MKEKWSGRNLLWIMIFIVVLSVCLTIAVVAGLFDKAGGEEEKYWFFQESLQTGKEVYLKNAYVYTNDNGNLEFLYENHTYQIEAKLAQTYTGVADITIDGVSISKVSIKPDSKNGTLKTYDETTIQIRGEAIEQLSKKPDIPIYQSVGNTVVQSDWNAMIVGTSQIKCIMEQGQVCSIFIEESHPENIHVLIKNGGEIYHSSLYIQKKSDKSIINVMELMNQEKKDEIEITDAEGLFLCDKSGTAKDAAYEGVLRIIKEAQGYVLINTLPIETYVKYVLPSEMPTSFHPEALKAQAVCARTFAYAHLGNQSYAKYGANLDDTTSFQVYHASGRYPETDKAVDETQGEIITHNGELITCYYFSTSAGKTNDMSVWGSKTPEYIAMRESPDSNSPFYNWTAYLATDKIKKLDVISRNEAGYVTKLCVTDISGKIKTYTNENEIRRVLGEHLQETVLQNGKIRTDLTMIPSAAFQVISTGKTQIQLQGGGFGHGIGMSQYGANRMAEEGIGYKAIIEHYFYEVLVKNV